jgi:Tfp pilus assembly protein PilN
VRPVNLIPPEERTREPGSGRQGLGTYAVLGGLAALLLAVTLVVLAGNSVADRKSERAKLERQKVAAQAKLTKLGSYTQFRDIQDRRKVTVTALAKSRFDWERVMRELSLVLPKSVWLTGLTASVRPDVQIANGPQNSLRDQIQGPAIELSGCGRSHEAVAVFLSRLEDIDGVTRVAATKSDRSQGSAAGSAASGGNCGKGTTFEAVAGLEGAKPTDAAGAGAGATPASSAGPASGKAGA